MKLELTKTETMYLYRLLNSVKLFDPSLLEEYEAPNTDRFEMIDTVIARLHELTTNDN